MGCSYDGGNADYPSGSSTVSIVQEDTNDNMTLYAAPGKLTKITQESITIAEGEKFRIWAGNGEKDIYYLSTCGTSKFTTADDGTCSEFNFPNTYWKVQSGGSNLISSGDWLYSEMNSRKSCLEQSCRQCLNVIKSPHSRQLQV